MPGVAKLSPSLKTCDIMVTMDGAPDQIDICDDMTRAEQALEDTISSSTSQTTKPKEFVCSTCSRTFGREEHRKRHERTHSKTRPFHCSLCTSTFSRKDILRRHVQKVHEVWMKSVGSRCASMLTRCTEVRDVWYRQQFDREELDCSFRP